MFVINFFFIYEMQKDFILYFFYIKGTFRDGQCEGKSKNSEALYLKVPLYLIPPNRATVGIFNSVMFPLLALNNSF